MSAQRGKAWLGPGIFISTNPEIGVSEIEIERCFYMRPKLTSIKGDHVGKLEAERIVQWLYSKRFKFIESLHYNFPKGKKV